ncbi:MAG: YiiX/YebB-like N1pC/P60 family cysteine hydrolase [Pseudomonadota bacterium]
MSKIRHGGFLALLGALVAGCAGAPDLAMFETVEWHETPDAAVAIDALPLRSGDIIVTEVDTAMSFMMALMADRYAPFVHAGVIVVDDGEPYVYDAFATVWPLLGRAPTRAMSGKIRRVPLARYLKRPVVAAIARAPDATRAAAVADFARQAYRDGLPFDSYFALETADAVYCTEFVAQALSNAGVTLPGPARRSRNRSLNVAFDWLGIETSGFWLAGDLIAPLQPVVRFSRTLSPAAIDARFALKAELHRRFTDEQALGNVFRWTGTGPRIRDHIVALYDDAVALAAAGAPDSAITELVAEHLGPGPEPTARLAERATSAPTPSPR